MSADRIIEEITSLMRRYVVFISDGQVLALALWVIHTFALPAAEATPYPYITSPERRSGKSRLLEVLEMLVKRGWMVSGPSEAVLYRKIGTDDVTLLLDEVDALFGTYVEKTEAIRGVLNSGSRRGGVYPRCVGPNHEVKDFPVFGAKALAGIDDGRLPDTVRDRSIIVHLHRRADEPVERFRLRRARQQAGEIVPAIEAWVAEHIADLQEAEPELPEELNDRAAEGWEPLIAIADAIGTDVGDRARKAAIELSGEEDIEDLTFGSQLLIDIHGIWTDELGTVLKSEEICSKLKGLEDRPWAAWGKGRAVPGFSPRDLARMLRPYGPRPNTVRLGGDNTAKGYHREQFADAWRRYVPDRSEEGAV